MSKKQEEKIYDNNRLTEKELLLGLHCNGYTICGTSKVESNRRALLDKLVEEGLVTNEGPGNGNRFEITDSGIERLLGTE